MSLSSAYTMEIIILTSNYNSMLQQGSCSHRATLAIRPHLSSIDIVRNQIL